MIMILKIIKLNKQEFAKFDRVPDGSTGLRGLFMELDGVDCVVRFNQKEMLIELLNYLSNY